MISNIRIMHRRRNRYWSRSMFCDTWSGIWSTKTQNYKYITLACTNVKFWSVRPISFRFTVNLLYLVNDMKKKVETNHKMKFLLFWAIVLLYDSAKYIALIPHRKLSTVSALSALILWWTSVHGEWGFVEYIHWVQNNHIRSSRITLVLGGRGDRSGS